MLLNSKDKQAAMDYTIFMMVGSFFDKTETASPGKEKIYHLRYQLLGHKTQYEWEEAVERHFLKKILPNLPKAFLDGTAKVHFVHEKDGRNSAVVFDRNGVQLWVSSQDGGKCKRPTFLHWITEKNEQCHSCDSMKRVT